MSAEPNASAPQGQAPSEPAADSSQVDAPGSQVQAGGVKEPPDPEKYARALSDAASYRERLRLANAKIEGYEKDKLTELEKLTKERDEALQTASDATRRARLAETQTAASKAGAHYPDVVARMVPDDAEDLDTALKSLRKQYPAMFRGASADGGAGTVNGGGVPAQDMDQFIRSAAGR